MVEHLYLQQLLLHIRVPAVELVCAYLVKVDVRTRASALSVRFAKQGSAFPEAAVDDILVDTNEYVAKVKEKIMK